MGGGRDRRHLHAGDRVVVRPPEQILATLGPDGTLDGLPFMAEMAAWCNRPFTVERRVAKTCVAVDPPMHPNRRFPGDDVVVLAGQRCDGSAHDGCSRACKTFWKEAWLRPLEPDEDPPPSEPATGAEEALRAALRSTAGIGRYFCQSTQLLDATAPLGGRPRIQRLRVLARELRDGDCSVREVAWLLALHAVQRLRRALRGDARLHGPHERAPLVTLGLAPGDRVRIKGRRELVATLDRHGTHRGLTICAETTRYCGGTAVVRSRVDRIINEQTGAMRELRDTVMLSDERSRRGIIGPPGCLCFNETGDCPRGEFMMWREAWLDRDPAAAPDGRAKPPCRWPRREDSTAAIPVDRAP
jgi:hypothetical protein